MILAARAQPTSAHARAPPTPRSCCASGSPPIRRPLHESDDPDGIVHRDLRLTLLIFESGLNCSHEGLRFVILHEPLAAVLLPTRIRTNLTSQLDQHRAPRKADCRHFVSPIRTHMTESYCFGESRGKVNGSGCLRSRARIIASGAIQRCDKAARRPRFADVRVLTDAGLRNGWRNPPVHAVTRGEGARRKRGACDVGRDLDGSEDA